MMQQENFFYAEIHDNRKLRCRHWVKAKTPVGAIRKISRYYRDEFKLERFEVTARTERTLYTSKYNKRTVSLEPNSYFVQQLTKYYYVTDLPS